MLIFKEKKFFEFTEKKSRFITKVYPVKSEDECKNILQADRAKYSDSTHIVYSYRVSGKTAFSDDGEPKGTAGRQIYLILIAKNITDVLVVVIRYYGGIQLGINGLIRAYSRGIKELCTSGMEEKRDFIRYEILSSYGNYSKIKFLLKKLQASFVSESFMDDVRVEAELETRLEEDFLQEIKIISYDSIGVKRIFAL